MLVLLYGYQNITLYRKQRKFDSHINTQTIFKFRDRLIGRSACLRLIFLTHVAAPGLIHSKRVTAKPAREGFVSMCACTEPVRTGIGAVCVEYGRSKWPITTLNHTHNHTNTQTHIPGTKESFVFYFWHPMLVRPVMKKFFFPLENQGKKGSLRSRASLLLVYVQRGFCRGGLTPALAPRMSVVTKDGGKSRP